MIDSCRVEFCGRVANLAGMCGFHRRRDVAGELEYDGERIFDLCSKGHRWTPSNTRIESNADGSKRRRCRACLADKARNKKTDAPTPLPPQAVRGSSPILQGVIDDFDEYQDQVDGLCKGNPAPYTDYAAKDVPSDVEAAKLCAGCPMLEACANNAVATRPGWGVWGGTVWLYGNPYTGDRSNFASGD